MSIAASLPHTVCNAQPHSVGIAIYRSRVTTTKDTLRANLTALLEKEAGRALPEGQTGVTALAKKAGKAVSWAQRLLDGTDTSMSKLEEVAEVFGLQAWQLLVPGFDPENPPGLSDDPRWPLPYVQRGSYESLPSDDRIYAQAKMQAAIEERQAARVGKRRAA